MCNAWNHPPACACGWGGEGHLGRSPGRSERSASAVTRVNPQALALSGRPFGTSDGPNAFCPVCGAAVYFYQSPAGGRVFFDDLGHPWPKHACTDQPHVAVKLREVERGVEPLGIQQPSLGEGEGEDWIPIQIAAPVFEGEHRVIVCRNLVDGQRFKVYVDRGFALGEATVASVTPWTAGGWTMLSICRLDVNSEPLILAGKREPALGLATQSPEFRSRFAAEESLIRKRREDARRRREEEEARELRAQRRAEARANAVAILDEVERLGAGDLTSRSGEQLWLLDRRWNRNAEHLGKGDGDLARRFTSSSFAIKARLDALREAEAAQADRVLRRKLTLEAERLADSGAWEVVGPRFREVIERWKGTDADADPEAAAQWQRIQSAFLIAREQTDRGGIRSKLGLLEELERLAQDDEVACDACIERLRDLVGRWWAAGARYGPVAATLHDRFMRLVGEVLQTSDDDCLRSYGARLRRDIQAATARGARTEDLPLGIEGQALATALARRDGERSD